MVDFFLLLDAWRGPEMSCRGIKKGIMELADALVINKADGKNKLFAETARAEYERAMHYLQPSTEGWTSHAFTCSAMTNEGIDNIWKVIGKYREITNKSGVFERHRKEQNIKWVHDMVDDHLRSLFAKHPGVNRIIKDVERSVAGGVLPAVAAVQQLISVFECKSPE